MNERDGQALEAAARRLSRNWMALRIFLIIAALFFTIMGGLAISQLSSLNQTAECSQRLVNEAMRRLAQ